jgi:tetratricopeptide (TPR) repeat protein
LSSAFFLQKGSLGLALEHVKEALRSSVENGTFFPEGLNCIIAAQIYFEKGDEKNAKELNFRAMSIAEELYQGLMACYSTLGRTAEALLAYERCREILSSVLGTSPSPQTESIRNTLKEAGGRT